MVEPNWVTALDRAVFVTINQHLRSSFLDAVFPFVSDMGLGHIQAISILLAVLVCGIHAGEFNKSVNFTALKQAYSKRKHWVYPLFLALAISGILSTVVKRSVVRDRPWGYYVNEHLAGREMGIEVVPPLRSPLKAHGFLSGHTATSFALATALALAIRRRKRGTIIAVLGWTLATLIGFSRIYVVDHWPLDVIAGGLLGIMCGVVATYLCRNVCPGVIVNEKEPLAVS